MLSLKKLIQCYERNELLTEYNINIIGSLWTDKFRDDI